MTVDSLNLKEATQTKKSRNIFVIFEAFTSVNAKIISYRALT